MRNTQDELKFLATSKIKVTYRAGSGERFLNDVKVWNGTEWVISQTEEVRDLIENNYDHIIRQHEHDNACGYGYFIIENGTITKSEYDNS